VIQHGLAPGEALGAALNRLPPEVSDALVAKLQEAMVTAFAEFVKGQSQKITAAAEDTADGISFEFTVRLAGLELVGKALLPAGSTAGVAEAIRGGSKPDVRLDVHPGFKCE
jgi:hypothetical protein